MPKTFQLRALHVPHLLCDCVKKLFVQAFHHLISPTRMLPVRNTLFLCINERTQTITITSFLLLWHIQNSELLKGMCAVYFLVAGESNVINFWFRQLWHKVNSKWTFRTQPLWSPGHPHSTTNTVGQVKNMKQTPWCTTWPEQRGNQTWWQQPSTAQCISFHMMWHWGCDIPNCPIMFIFCFDLFGAKHAASFALAKLTSARHFVLRQYLSTKWKILTRNADQTMTPSNLHFLSHQKHVATMTWKNILLWIPWLFGGMEILILWWLRIIGVTRQVGKYFTTSTALHCTEVRVQGPQGASCKGARCILRGCKDCWDMFKFSLMIVWRFWRCLPKSFPWLLKRMFACYFSSIQVEFF